MASRHSYVVVTGGPEQLRYHRAGTHPRGGRHRLGHPGTEPRRPDGRSRRRGLRRARHRRRTERPSMSAVRYASLLVLLGTVGVSGWFAAVGATAFAQMIQP